MADTRKPNKPNGLNKKVIGAAAVALACLFCAGAYFAYNLYGNKAKAQTAAPAATQAARPTPAATQAARPTPAATQAARPTPAATLAQAVETPVATEEPASAAEETPSAEAPVETIAPEPDNAVIMLTGDLLCLGAQIGAANKGGAYDFEASFAPVRDIFAQADFVAGNLETVVSPDSPYTATGQAGMPVLNAPASYLAALQSAGFDGLATVNNHCCDYGAQGITRTIDALDSYGFAHTGTFAAPEDERWFIAEAGGIRVGFLAYSNIYNGKDGLLTEEERGYMINRFSEEGAQRDVRALREAGAEFVIAYLHWGMENQPAPVETQRQYAQQLADAGVDVIAGSHPHCLQPAAYLDAADGRRVLCFYSLGNFISSMASTANNDTVIAQLDLERAAEGVLLAGASYYPCRVAGKDGVSFVVSPVTSDDSAYRRICQSMGDAMPPAQ